MSNLINNTERNSVELWKYTNRCLECCGNKNTNKAIDDVYNSAKNELLRIKSVHCGNPKIIEVLHSLKKIKQLRLKNKTLFDYLLTILGLRQDKKISGIDKLINKTERKIDKFQNIQQEFYAAFKEEDRKFLSILNKLTQSTNQQPLGQKKLTEVLDESEQRIFYSYLQTLGGKRKITSAIAKLNEMEKGEDFLRQISERYLGTTPEVVDMLDYLINAHTFATRKNIVPIIDKATLLSKSYSSKSELPSPTKPIEKLSIKEFALFDLVPEGNQNVNDLSHFFTETTCGTHLENVKKMRDLKRHLMLEMKVELHGDAIPSGSLNFYDEYKYSSVHNRNSVGVMSHLQIAITRSRYTHAGIIYKDQAKDDFFQSHVMGAYDRNKVGFHDLAVADYYALDWTKLIREQDQTVLTHHFGNEWQKKIQSFYEQICSDFHSQDRENVNNGVFIRFTSVLKLHKQWEEIDPEEFDFENREMFCSQFVGMATMLTLHQLNQKLKEAIPDLDHDIIISPFSNNENFAAMHPGYLMDVMKEYCRPTPKLKMVEHMVDFDPFHQ